MDAVRALEDALGVEFTDPTLLRLALTHRSYAFEADEQATNERMEFLGDAVLGLVVTDRIYTRYAEATEGRLAKLRAASVSTRSLARVARDLELGEWVRLGKGEEASGGRDKDTILADTLEAVLGAVYLDQGLDVARGVILALFDDLLLELAAVPGSLDYKTSLQELTAAELGVLPAYDLGESGPDHAKQFTADVRVDGEVLGTGSGRSKKEAEQGAAAQAYVALATRVGHPTDTGTAAAADEVRRGGDGG